MRRDGSGGAGRLLARARRPAVNPWGLATLREAEVDAAPPLASSVGSPVEPSRRSIRSTEAVTRTLEPGAAEPVSKAAPGETSATSSAPPARPVPLHALEPAPTGSGQSSVAARRAAAQPRPPEPAMLRSADQDSGPVGEEPAGRDVTAPGPSVPISAAAPFEAPAERTAGPPQVPRAVPSTSAVTRRRADSPDGGSGVAAGQPARRPAAAPAVMAVAESGAVARIRPKLDATAQPEPQPSAGSPVPAVVIDEIRIVTPPAASPARDPLASLAAQRVGASRHRGRRALAGVTAIQGVDETLKEVAKQAVASLSPKPDVTVGPLDRDDDDLRLNWFLYRVSPNPAYRNMEPPSTGWRTARGRPPLALRLSYLLTAFPASSTNGGDQEQFAHAGLAAAMRELHENAVINEGEPILSALAKPLVEPLRITIEDLDLEAISKIWTAVSKPLRLSVGYEVSLVVVDSTQVHTAGAPVRTRRFAVAPSLGPRLVSASPSRVGHGVEITVAVEGLTSGTIFTLAREAGDPPAPRPGRSPSRDRLRAPSRSSSPTWGSLRGLAGSTRAHRRSGCCSAATASASPSSRV